MSSNSLNKGQTAILCQQEKKMLMLLAATGFYN